MKTFKPSHPALDAGSTRRDPASRAGCGVLLIVLLLTSCISTPPVQDSKIPAPELWSRVSGSAVAVDKGAAIQQDWWKNFDDAMLNQLVQEALENNKSLKIAKARVTEAKALKQEATAVLLPRIDGTALAQRQRLGYFTQGQIFSVAEADVQASWELDLFGRNQARVREAKALEGSEVAATQGVMVTLLAEVARNYFDMRNFARQIEITNENLKNQQQTLELTKMQFEGALLSDFDVQRAAAQVSDTEAELPTLKAAYDASLNRLSVLLGARPGDKDLLLKTQAELRPLKEQTVIAAPADVLRNRPDVKVAERQFAASVAESDAAFDDLFPTISLTALYGVQASKGASAHPFNLVANLTQPILHFGELEAAIDIADSRQEQAFYNYQETVLEALEDMENALSGYVNETGRNVSLNNSVAQNRKAAELAKLQFTDGDLPLLDVLVADRNVLLAESNLVQSDTLLRKNLVNIYTAAGGGWDLQAEPQAAPVVVKREMKDYNPVDFVGAATQ